MGKLTRKQFTEVQEAVCDALEDVYEREDEYYGFPSHIASHFFEIVEERLFGEEIAKEKRREQYLALKAEFEPDNRSEV